MEKKRGGEEIDVHKLISVSVAGKGKGKKKEKYEKKRRKID